MQERQGTGKPQDVPLHFAPSPENYDAETIANFSKLTSALTNDPSVLRVPSNTEPDLAENVEELVRVAERESHRVGLRGTDFLPNNFRLTEEQNTWLQAHPEIAVFNSADETAIARKVGRLAVVVAGHEQRDTIAEAVVASGYGQTSYALSQEHIARLLTHTNAPACTNFALEMIRHVDEYRGRETADYQPFLPGSVDGNTAAQFWTYGPYVLEGIEKAGGNFRTFIDKWVLKRQRVREFPDDSTYPGIEGLYSNKNRVPNFNYLGQDGNSLSHKVVKLIADKAILPSISEPTTQQPH